MVFLVGSERRVIPSPVFMGPVVNIGESYGSWPYADEVLMYRSGQEDGFHVFRHHVDAPYHQPTDAYVVKTVDGVTIPSSTLAIVCPD